ncbi:MAG: DMT family transporter [Chitinophagaceae bacterium]
MTFLGAVLFSTKAIIVKVAFAHTKTDALTLLTLRMLFALPFYLVSAWAISRNKDNPPLTKKQWLFVFILGLFGYYLSSLFDFIGLQYVSAGLERLILFLYPTFAVLINAVVFRQPITGIQKIALALTYLGIGIAYVGELHIDTSNPNFFWGSFLIFLCAVTYSSYIAGSGYMVPRIGAARFTSYSMLAATAGIFIHFLVAGNYHSLYQQADLWWYGVLLAIIATVIPTFMLSEGMKRIGTNNVAIISAIGPVSTILQAHFILHEKIFMAQVAGTLLVVMGVLIIGWKKDRL